MTFKGKTIMIGCTLCHSSSKTSFLATSSEFGQLLLMFFGSLIVAFIQVTQACVLYPIVMKLILHLLMFFLLPMRKVARPIASAMRKGINMHPSLQGFIAETAKKKQKEEKEFIEKAAQDLVIYMIAGSALVYYQTRPSLDDEMIQMHKYYGQKLDKLLEKLEEPKNSNRETQKEFKDRVQL